eukprot:CAMPEP_0113892756 /NCGR_PEP_ID=MMETSP0780_2-20120614/15628_1 /TAXON_ID=652834 /ORGANISM="Palpitomonas bilix" /LENGTH=271 /DNA_ID=CAMNT_0000882799 /DNA_START=103 /DNA_END=914 /DNA_ORIENTATION=+ /assembly_acc=CAM_ASM_000599
MAQASAEVPSSGFTFDLCQRNEMLAHKGDVAKPKAMKTGTTICGVVFDGGVVLGADTRATGGSVVMDPNCEKIHFISKNIYCCGAGTAADTENVTGMMSSQLELLRLATGREIRVAAAATSLAQYLWRYQGHVSAALVLGGVDFTGPSLYSIHPHGSVDFVPFITMGSGSLAAMAVMESGYKDKLTREEAKMLVHDAILAGIQNDLGSGSNVDLNIITSDGVEYLRNFRKCNEKYHAPEGMIKMPRGTTAIAEEAIRLFKTSVEVTDGEAA